ncbi:MAG: hypothetical protein WCL04_10530, partial [Verrucomicrobiota bacterium]
WEKCIPTPPETNRQVTADEARRIAVWASSDRSFATGEVRDGAEANVRAYAIDKDDCWVVYRSFDYDDDVIRLQSSWVALVCKRTGRLVYVGSAHDEG